MRRPIVAALIAAIALPLVVPGGAAAQSRAELRRDRQDIREERRDLDRARARGDWRDVREQRDDLREARQEYRDDLRDHRRAVRDDRWRGEGQRGDWRRDDWRDWRRDHRDLYAGRGWRAPFAYRSFRPGGRIAPAYYGGRYAIGDPGRYHLPRANRGATWVRHYDDVLLVDRRRGVVLDVIRGFYW